MAPQVPSECPKCDIGDFLFGTFIPMDEETMYCHACTQLTILGDEETEVTDSPNRCPHCKATNTFAISGDEVWCGECGFDPDDELESEELATLWKRDSQIERLLSRGRAGLGSKVGAFLRSGCGPHCPFEKNCPQSVANLAKCYKECSDTNGSEMSKRSKKARKAARQQRQLEARKKSRGMAACADIGWFKRRWSDREITNYGIKNNSSQQSRDTER